jgi:hypothetical protein
MFFLKVARAGERTRLTTRLILFIFASITLPAVFYSGSRRKL